jgi:hypothetical protein
MNTRLEGPVAQFSGWRKSMVERIDEFRSWMDAYCPADIEQTLRIYDLVEALRNDSIRITVVGHGARGKTELVNALLFPDVAGGLLPGGAGSEFLAATEVFHVPDERPFVRMLPMETRKRRDSFAALKRNPVDWVQMRLDPNSPESMSEMATSLTESREVGADEARALGFDVPEGVTALRIPAWRYALINFPHAALQSGLTVYYTPDLALLKSEPEIALRMISSAQSLLFVLEGSLTPLAHEMWLSTPIPRARTSSSFWTQRPSPTRRNRRWWPTCSACPRRTWCRSSCTRPSRPACAGTKRPCTRPGCTGSRNCTRGT